jgi:hypothetical protein
MKIHPSVVIASDATAMAWRVEGLFCYSAGLFVTRLLGTYVTEYSNRAP